MNVITDTICIAIIYGEKKRARRGTCALSLSAVNDFVFCCYETTAIFLTANSCLLGGLDCDLFRGFSQLRSQKMCLKEERSSEGGEDISTILA